MASADYRQHRHSSKVMVPYHVIFFCVLLACSFFAGRLSILLPSRPGSSWQSNAGIALQLADNAAAQQMQRPGSAEGQADQAVLKAAPANGDPPATNTTDSIKLFVGVLSASNNRQRRDAVRQTWGSDTRLERVVFVVGRPANHSLLDAVQQEALEHKDIILVGHIQEHYLNITHQTLEIFRAAYAYHKPLTHVMKCDDDSYIHVGELFDHLSPLPRHLFWTGRYTKFRPKRNESSKWYTSEEDWPSDSPPIRYPNGPGYVVTADLADLIATGGAVRCMPEQLFKWEDAAFGMWLHCISEQHGLKIGILGSTRFGVLCSNGDLLSHKISSTRMRCIHANGGCCLGQ